MANERVLEGKVIVITGAGRGVGRDCALLAAAHGAKVVVNDLGSTVTGEGADEKVAEQVVREIRAAKLGICGLSRQIALEMSRFRVRSNCIAPNAFSRMIEAIPTNTPEQAAHVESRRRGMSPAKIAPMAVFLLSELAREVNGQIFSVRANEIFLVSQPRPIRSAHHAEGWTPQRIADRVLPAFRASLVPLERSRDVLSWDPI